MSNDVQEVHSNRKIFLFVWGRGIQSINQYEVNREDILFSVVVVASNGKNFFFFSVGRRGGKRGRIK